MTINCITEISIYPIKSTAGIQLSTSFIDDYGLAFDRRFVVSDLHGQFITARTEPKLCLISSCLTPSGLHLNAPNMPALTIDIAALSNQTENVQVWRDNIQAQATNETCSQWLSDYLQKPCKLLYFGKDAFRLVKNRVEQVAFADGYPLLLISEASLIDLNQHCSSKVSMRQFRPNLVVNGSEPFIEDTWKTIRIGEVMFEVVKPCSRCIFTTIDPKTAEKHQTQEPLATLQQYRQDDNGEVMFGQNLVPLNQGKITVNDTVEVIATQKKAVYSNKLSKPVIANESVPPASNKKKKVNILFDAWDKNVIGNNQQTILEQGEAAGLILPYSCRAGMCGRCKVKLESGDVSQLATDGLSDEDKRQGYILACSCIPQSDVVINRG
jgi:hypothetical protein